MLSAILPAVFGNLNDNCGCRIPWGWFTLGIHLLCYAFEPGGLHLLQNIVLRGVLTVLPTLVISSGYCIGLFP
ncbi:hypothetical protein EV426DRAFT_619827 [Tirmania nivea]|nr:hypothetical protein EV426DRAFT_619827 [Tirmania nivea]